MNVEQEITDLKARVSNVESKVVAAFISGDNWVKRNALWLIPVAGLVGFLIGHYVGR